PECMTSICPAMDVPRWGCLSSTMRPVSRSLPPQKDRGASSTSSGPVAVPGCSDAPEMSAPDVIIVDHLSLPRRLDAFRQTCEYDVYSDVAGSVVGPLS